MAVAFGGRVIKSPKGRGVGPHDYVIPAAKPWMDPVGSIAVPASHQDQGVDKPPIASVIAARAFTPYAWQAYRDPPAISFQFHPEFEAAYVQALMEGRRDRVADSAGAIASLKRPNDGAQVGDWIRRFLDTGE
ncbi:MAG: hypothetical protein ACRYHQ_37110 [Janthinobacterium lividum]